MNKKYKIKEVKDYLCKQPKWLTAILISLLIVLIILCPFHIAISFFLVLILLFSPFIHLINKYINRKKSTIILHPQQPSLTPFEPKVLGFPFKDFMTIWIAFFGFLGVAGGIIQVQRQILNQDKQLRDTRFSSGVELLGNQNESARIGGAYNLFFLASEYPKEYLESVSEILCAHIRTITGEKEYQEKNKNKPSNETQTIINLLFQKNKNNKLIFDKCYKNLDKTFLNGIILDDAILSNVFFKDVVLCDVYFFNTTLRNTRFVNATLRNVSYVGNTTLKKVDFWRGIADNIYFHSDMEEEIIISDVSFSMDTINDVSFLYSSGRIIFRKVYFFASDTIRNISLSGATSLYDVSFSDISDFSSGGAKLNNVDFNGKLRNSAFNSATLSNVTFFRDTLSNIEFNNATLSNIKFEDATLSDVKFRNATISNVNFGEVYFGKVRVNASLEYVDFSDAILKKDKVFFTGTPLENIPFEEITREGRSLELTTPKE